MDNKMTLPFIGFLVIMCCGIVMVYSLGYAFGKIEGKAEVYEKTEAHYKQIIERKEELIKGYHKACKECTDILLKYVKKDIEKL